MAELPKIAGGEEVLEDLPSEQLVIFIRHAESRWNRAQAALSPLGMLWENDHGLSEEGRLQAERLRTKLREAQAHGVEEMKESEAGEAAWLSKLLSPDVVYSSPFTRALQTACIALQDILPKSHLVVMREAREHKRLGGADSTGVAVGEEIRERVREEIYGLYEDDPEKSAQVLKELEQITMDTSSVTEEWWGNVLGETFEEIDENLEALMHRLRCSRGSLAGGGAVAVLVGHSYIIRTIFDAYLMKGAATQYRSLRSKLIPCCGVVAARITWDEHGPKILEAMPLLNTTL
ncbi:unnamed protein product, partial [Cladocopium goreaui]